MVPKEPSIERFLGSSHGRFKHLDNSRAINLSSPRDSGTDTVPPSASHGFLGDTNASGSLDVFKTVPMPVFPIRVFNEPPPPFSLELQRRKMRWRYRWLQGLGPDCIQNPKIDCIQDTARPYIESIAPGAKIISVTLLARGSFNLAYNLTAENVNTGFHRSYIFRVALPIWPYYKVESDVATTEFVRHATSIPVPIIYAFDSNPHNELGYEWMLMERVQGTALKDVWDGMEFDAKQSLVQRIASCMAELSHFKFSKLGSIFMRYRQSHIDFYIGPTIHERLFEGDRLLHEVDRGPFQSLQALYSVILDLTQRHLNDPRHRIRHALEDTRSGELELDEEPPSPDMTHGTHSEGSDSLETVLARADAEDQENERDYGMSKRQLSRFQDDVQKYRAKLPQLCALLPAAEPFTTILTHPDLQEANIFVDNANTLVALIDWERARLEPIAIIDFIPKFLEDGEPDVYYVPSRTTVPEVVGNIQVYDYEKLASARGMYESSYQALMHEIQRTRLRIVYRDELIRLKSFLCRAFNRDPDGLEQQLMYRVYWSEDPANTSAAFWMEKYLDESVSGGSDDDTDEGSKAQPRKDG